ncbi:MAG TPA: extracellular solute-binding protein, partial [Capsulimonadaceae bacterium]|nr:extracellular solute-binding protein [Capsulimonadaceae bacterium]
MRRYQTRAVWLLLALLLFVPIAAQADGNNVVIRFRYWGDFKEIAIIHQTVKAFERDHPGVTVHDEHVTSSGSEYIQKLLVEQAAGLTPDVIFCGGSYTELAEHGMLADLTPFLKGDHTVHINDYYPQVLKAFQIGGKLYALPRDIAPMGLVYYNKAIFDRAHVPYPDGSWSWDYTPHPERGYKDFLTVAKALTLPAQGGQPATFGYGAGDPSWTMDNFIYSSGGALVDNVFTPTKLLYNDPKVVKAIQLTQDLEYRYNVSPSPVDLQSSGLGTVGAHDLFAQGRLGMYVCGIWEVPRFRDEIKNFDWDIAAFPKGPTGLRGVQTGWSGYGMAATSKHKQEAWELLTYLAGPNGLSRLAKSGLAQPAIARLANSALWLDGLRPKNRKLTIEEVPYIHYDVLYPNWDQISTKYINPKLQLVWNKTLTAQQAVDQIMPPAQALLDQLNHPAYHPKLNWSAAIAFMVLVTLLIVLWVWQGARSDIRAGRRLGRPTEARAGYAFIAPWIIGALVFLLAPMLVSLVLAFSSWNMIEPARWVGAGNLAEMAGDQQFWKSLEVTGVYTIFSVPLGIAGSL